MSVSNLKQLKKTESKKPENPADSILGSDPNSEIVNLDDVLELLKQLRTEVNRIPTEVTGIPSDLSVITTRIDNNSTEVKTLQHSKSALTDTINKVRGFNRELLLVTSDFKKDAYDY